MNEGDGLPEHGTLIAEQTDGKLPAEAVHVSTAHDV
jgi:hypothetical protein